jgi:peptidoglycan/xylan/chitin deacetylase (PgdA/CDA1 family)
MTAATIVMYHIVQPAGGGVVGRLKGRDRQEFAGQLAYLRRHYTPIRLSDLAAAAGNANELPPSPVVLTFDDGYRSHATVVAAMLSEARIPATFFPIASSLIDREVVTVNKIQCILASADIGWLISRVESAIERDGAGEIARYRQRWFKASRWDSAEVVYVKRLLQHALADDIREPLVSELFRRLVTSDERALADDLYMTVEQARQLHADGMTIGAHADRHLRLPTLSRQQQAREIDGALRVLDAIGVARNDFAYSYANGDYDDHSMALLRERGCRVAVSTRAELAAIAADALLALPRLDTNDLPFAADAEPNAWTHRATAGQIGS